MRGSHTNRSTMRGFAGLVTVAAIAALGADAANKTAATPAAASKVEDAAKLVGSPVSIVVEPREVHLLGPRATQQVIVTGRYADGFERDLTRLARFKSDRPDVAEVAAAGVITPKAAGVAVIQAEVGGKKAQAVSLVRDTDRPTAISFHNDVIAVLARAGCSSGACHGTPSGKNGFRISLRGYDPAFDYDALTRDMLGRRVSRAVPEDSLMLKKPLMEVAHEGGKRFTKHSLEYETLRGWIAAGLPADAPTTPMAERIDVTPARRVLMYPAREQQLVVRAYYSDGSVRDVTKLAMYSSSSTSVAEVDTNGLVKGVEVGESAILCRYLDKTFTVRMMLLKPVPNFAWTSPPENNYIDKHVLAKLRTLEIQPSDVCTDEEFVRRAYLDSIGVAPTADEARKFLADTDAKKREKLIDALVERLEFVDFWTLKWADVLRSNRNGVKLKGIFAYQEFIRDTIAADKPMDQFVRELLTARGSAFKNPAANYYRIAREATDTVETTAQLFLGVRVQCAKCHNHPFERWTQDDYYGLAAFFARVKHGKASEADDEIIYSGRSGEMVQPRTGKTMPPKFLGGAVATVSTGGDRREALAAWLTGPENPFFAKAVANRIWYHVMGRGIIDPPDDIRDSNPPCNDELLEALVEDFVQNRFSLKHLVRTIMKSRTYQLSSATNPLNEKDEIYFSHAKTKLLSAEPLLDAICQAMDVPEKFPGLPLGTRATQLPDPKVDHYFLKIFGQPQREMACECERGSDSNLSQALQMINGQLISAKLRDPNNRIGKMMTAGKKDPEIIEELFLSAVARKPKEPELKAAAAHIGSAGDRRKALEDVAWAVLNSKEFLFRH